MGACPPIDHSNTIPLSDPTFEKLDKIFLYRQVLFKRNNFLDTLSSHVFWPNHKKLSRHYQIILNLSSVCNINGSLKVILLTGGMSQVKEFMSDILLKVCQMIVALSSPPCLLQVLISVGAFLPDTKTTNENWLTERHT